MAKLQRNLHSTYDPQPDTLYTPTWRLTCDNDFSQSIVIHTSQAVLTSMLSVPAAVKDKVLELSAGAGFNYQLAVEYTIYSSDGSSSNEYSDIHGLSSDNFIDLLPEKASAAGVTVAARMYMKSLNGATSKKRSEELRQILGGLPPVSIFWQIQS